MSSLVLLDRNGAVVHKIHFVSLSSDYIVPEGMTLSWRTAIHISSSDPRAEWRPKEPVEAFFYLGEAQGQVCQNEVSESEARDQFFQCRYASRILTVTVQGTSTRNVMRLRERILHLINSGTRWGVSNDLNPRPKRVGFLPKLWRRLRMELSK